MLLSLSVRHCATLIYLEDLPNPVESSGVGKMENRYHGFGFLWAGSCRHRCSLKLNGIQTLDCSSGLGDLKL